MAGKDSGSLLVPLILVACASRRSGTGSSRRASATLACALHLGALSAALASLAGGHILSGLQPIRAIHHNVLAGLQAIVQNGHLPLGQSHLYDLDPGGSVSLCVALIIDHPHIRTLQASLYGRRGNH